MKNLTTLFFLFIILISLAPCSDDLECDDVPRVTSYQIAHSDELPLENCTSICICTCCGQRTVAVQQVSFEIDSRILVVENIVTSHSSSVVRLAKNIWQPPKIG